MTLLLELQGKDRDKISIAAETIKHGGTVVFPTETVYGIGANAFDEKACLNIFKAKERPADNPLIVHIANFDDLQSLTTLIDEDAERLIKTFWPGPLTLIFKKLNRIPRVVSAGLDTVAVRMPNDEIALELILQSGVPIAAPSANRSGKPSPTRSKHVIEDMMGRVDVILVNGDVLYGVESTVLDVTEKPYTILRPGAITFEMLNEIIPGIVLDSSLLTKADLHKPKSPGMKYRHYAPNAKVYVVDQLHNDDRIQQIIEDYRFRYNDIMYIDLPVEELSRALFAKFREADEKGIKVILVKAVTAEGMGLAVMNRLLKAANYNVI